MSMLDKAFKQRKKNRLNSLKKLKEVKPIMSLSRVFQEEKAESDDEESSPSEKIK